MKNYVLIATILVLILSVGCMHKNRDNAMQQQNQQGQQSMDPTTQSLYLASSSDGLTFTNEKLLLERAGVGHLMVDKNGRLILTFQYFSAEDEEMFDVIAYMISEDNGKTWSALQKLEIEGLPEPIGYNTAVDPTLIKLSDDSLRLYFTYQSKDQQYPTLVAARNADGLVEGVFTYEEISYIGEEPGITMLDPAVVFFDGNYHHYTWQHDSEENIHMISKMGLIFQQQEDISLPMGMLGSVIKTEHGIVFYGTQEGNVASATSEDGYTWTMQEGTRAQGADPGVVHLADGSYLMVFTRLNNGAKK